MLNKSELTAKWWQYFLQESNRAVEPPPAGIYFVKGKIDVLNDKSIHKTEDLVESDKTIIMPIDNWISLVRRPILKNRNRAMADMTHMAKIKMDRTAKLTLRVDGNNLHVPTTRVVSPFFNVMLNSHGLDILRGLEVGSSDGDLKPGPYMCISDGYWLFMEANTLTRGPHKIETFGSCATGLFELEIHHYLHII